MIKNDNDLSAEDIVKNEMNYCISKLLSKEPVSGADLCYARRSAGLTKKQLARLFEIPEETIENYEIGGGCPRLYSLSLSMLVIANVHDLKLIIE